MTLETHATPAVENDAIDKRKDVDDKPMSSKFWLGEIEAAKKRDRNWAERGKKVVARYIDEREFDREQGKTERRANILWANTELLKGTLFQGISNPDVRRRFPKKGKDGRAARQAALVLERALSTCMDLYDTESQIEAAVEDYLLPGRGTAWIVYEAEVRKANPEADDASDGEDQAGEQNEGKTTTDLPPKNTPPGYPNLGLAQGGLLQGSPASKGMAPGAGLLAQAGEGEAPASPTQETEDAAGGEEEVYNQLVRIDHVYWEDYLCSAGRKDSDVWWKARAHSYSRDELKKYWPNHADKIPLDVMVGGYTTTGRGKDDPDTFRRARVWEVWDKSKKRRIYVAEGYKIVLESEKDPYKLKDFYPTVEPLYGVKRTSSLQPTPEYCLYQDQAEELDLITTRLARLIGELKRRGVYDAGAEGNDASLSQLAFADDNVFLPYKNFVALLEKGGLKGVFQAEDLQPTVIVVEKLYQQRQVLIQTIYEVTGISDVIRGATNPNETATAQRIKGQFGSLRMQKRQKRVQTFIRDLFRIKAELMAEHFTREQLQEMSGVMMPTRIEQAQAKQTLLAIQKQMEQSQQSQQALQQWQQAQSQAVGSGQPAVGGQPGPQTPQGPAPMGHNGGPPGPMPGAAQVPGQVPGMPTPPPQVIPPPNVDPEQIQLFMETAKAVVWEDIEQILRSDERRSYKVDVETDNTSAMDNETEKAQRIEFLSTMQGFMERVIPLVMQFPALANLAKESIMFALQGFKVGRTMEETFTDAFEQLEGLAQKQMQAGPQPDPKVAAELQKIQAQIALMQQKAQADLEMTKQQFQADLAMHQQELQAKAVDTQAKIQQDQVKTQADMMKEKMKLATAQQTNAMKMAQMAAQVQMDQKKQQMELQKSEHELQSSKTQAMVDAWTQSQQQQHTERVQAQEMQLNERRHSQESEHAERSFQHETAREHARHQHETAREHDAHARQAGQSEADHRQRSRHADQAEHQKLAHTERQARAKAMLQAAGRVQH